MIKPKEKFPELTFELINGTTWKLSKQDSKSFTMLLFYRGLHCPVCKKQLKELTSKLEDFTKRGVNVIAISMDSEERAKKTVKEWEVESLPIAFGMKEETARKLGLYISKAVSEKEPKVFSEPGLFLVRKDGSLYSSSIQTMPFARPQLEDILKGIDYILKEDYPARGGE